jgi:phage-related protein
MGLAIAEDAALWPILAIAAAIAALIAVIYGIGVAFGWWDDVGSMIDAIWAGINRLWSAFINHPDVQATIEVISNALSTLWSWITQAGQAILEFFGVATGGQFDVVAALINVVGQAWNAMTYPLRVVIGAVQQVISAFNSFRTGQMDLPAFIMTVLQALVNVYLNTFGRIVQLIIQFGARMISSGVSAASRFVSNILNHIRQLPGRIYSALMTVVGRISSAIQSWISTAVSKVTTLISNITSPVSGVAGKISSALSGVVNAITQPFQNAWNTVKPIVDKINNAVSTVGNALSGIAAGGEDLESTTNQSVSINNGEYTLKIEDKPIVIEDNIKLTLDLINVPTHISTNDLINGLRSKKVLQALTSNRDFQELDMKVKSRIDARSGRMRGA